MGKLITQFIISIWAEDALFLAIKNSFSHSLCGNEYRCHREKVKGESPPFGSPPKPTSPPPDPSNSSKTLILKRKVDQQKTNLILPEESMPMKDKAPQPVQLQSQFNTEQPMQIAISIFQLFIIQ